MRRARLASRAGEPLSRGPHDAPLGATPTLPAPEETQATRRAQVAFERYVSDKRKPKPKERREAEAPPPRAASPRRYDLALALGFGDTAPEPLSSELTDPGADEPLPRPPPGAPAIRAGARRPAVEALPQDILESTAESALLVADPDGSTSFEVAIRDEVFADLACRITLRDDGLVATFRVGDDNLRRLLEAEAGRLRARLEERGLRVRAIEVVVA